MVKQLGGESPLPPPSLMETTMTSIPNLDALYKDMPLLGHNVSWLLRGVEVTYDELKSLLEKHGFPGYVPTRPPPAKRAIRRAIRDWIVWRLGRPVTDDDDDDEQIDVRVTAKRGRGARSNKLIRTVGEESESKWLVFSMITENRDIQELALDYATDVRFFLHKSDARLLCTTEARGMIDAENEAERIAREIAPFWERHKSLYLPGDISRVLTAIMPSLGSVSVREGGGSYFVPTAYQDGLERIKALVTDLPTSTGRAAVLLTFPLLDIAAVRDQIRQAADEDFYAELDRAEKDLKRFVEQNEAKPGSVKKGTITARIEAYMELRRKAKVYADSSGMRQERILDEIAALEGRARSLLAAADDARDERAEAAEVDLSRLGDLSHSVRGERTV
jgi:hypothetical protein